MAGHSKWANIQHRKNAQDAKRGRIFTRLIREVTVAARQGGGDPGANPRLRLAIDRALAANMAKDNIERAIKKAVGELDGVCFDEVRYEGYAPGGVAVIVDCVTDNRNRTVAEVRHAFSKFGGNLGTTGSVAHLFSHLGAFSYAPGVDLDRLLALALDLGAEDVREFDDGSAEVISAAADFERVREGLVAAALAPADAELTMRAELEVALDLDTAERVLKLLERLEDLDDTQNVHTNASFPEDAYAAS